MARVFVTRQLPGDALGRLSEIHDVVVWPHRLPPDPSALAKNAAGAGALLTTVDDRVDSDLIAQLPQLKLIANYAVGYDNIDIKAAAARGISVSNTPDVLTDATADLTWALLLACARQIVPAAACAARDWLTWEPAGFLGAQVARATLGIIGPGRIGQAVARRGRGFDMTVLTAGRSPKDQQELFARSDFISLHCPLTVETRHLINKQTLALMRPKAILINTARGGIVDHDALAGAVSAGHIGGAALDVTEPEPLSPEHPLHRTPGVLITPHIGSATRWARSQMAHIAVDNILAGLAGRPLPTPVVTGA